MNLKVEPVLEKIKKLRKKQHKLCQKHIKMKPLRLKKRHKVLISSKSRSKKHISRSPSPSTTIEDILNKSKGFNFEHDKLELIVRVLF